MSQQSQKSQQREERKQAQRAEANAKATKQKIMFGGGILIIIVGFALLLKVVFGGSTELITSENNTSDPVKGNPDAEVVVSEYSDFQCPACKQMAPILEQLVTEYGDRIAFEYNDFPLQQIHPNALEAAEAGQCAFQQDAFWEYHDILFEEQSNWATDRNPTDVFVEYAGTLELNTDVFQQCLTTNAQRTAVREDIAEGDAADVSGTPTIFINGQKWANTGTYQGLAEAVEEALGETNSDETVDAATANRGWVVGLMLLPG